MKLGIFAGAVIALSAMSPVFAVEVRDQHWPWNSNGVWGFSSEQIGTIFDIGIDGLLSRIDVYVDPAPGLRWEIHPVENGLPKLFDAPPLASGTFAVADPSADLVVSLDLSASNLLVKSGQQYALCLAGRIRLGGSQWMSYRGPDAPYARNFQYSTLTQTFRMSGPSNYDPPYSTAYSTYVNVIPEPSALALMAIGCAVISIRRR